MPRRNCKKHSNKGRRKREGPLLLSHLMGKKGETPLKGRGKNVSTSPGREKNFLEGEKRGRRE